MFIFNKLKYKKVYEDYLCYVIDGYISEISNKIHLESVFDNIENFLTLLQNEFGSIKKYLVHRYGKNEYKLKYFLYNNIEEYLRFLFRDEFYENYL